MVTRRTTRCDGDSRLRDVYEMFINDSFTIYYFFTEGIEIKIMVFRKVWISSYDPKYRPLVITKIKIRNFIKSVVTFIPHLPNLSSIKIFIYKIY